MGPGCTGIYETYRENEYVIAVVCCCGGTFVPRELVIDGLR
jgi:hypothetical protein